jgi:hypothetical protein
MLAMKSLQTNSGYSTISSNHNIKLSYDFSSKISINDVCLVAFMEP